MFAIVFLLLKTIWLYKSIHFLFNNSSIIQNHVEYNLNWKKSEYNSVWTSFSKDTARTMFSSKKQPANNVQQQQQPLQACSQNQNLSQHQQQMLFHKQQIDLLTSNSSSSNINSQHQPHHLHHFKSDVRSKNVMINTNHHASSSQPILNETNNSGSVSVTLAQTPTKLNSQMKLIASNNAHTGKIYQNENLNLK